MLYNSGNYNLSEFVDGHRIERLQKAGYEVELQSIPEQFTPKNRLILASPPAKQMSSDITIGQSTNLPRLVSIPIDDSSESRRVIRSMAGRTAADQRKRPLPPSFCVSLAMTTADGVTTAKLTSAAKDLFCNHNDLVIKVEYADTGPFLHAYSGKYFRTFRVSYGNKDESLIIQKQIAKKLHENLCMGILSAFPGTNLRC